MAVSNSAGMGAETAEPSLQPPCSPLDHSSLRSPSLAYGMLVSSKVSSVSHFSGLFSLPVQGLVGWPSFLKVLKGIL